MNNVKTYYIAAGQLLVNAVHNSEWEYAKEYIENRDGSLVTWSTDQSITELLNALEGYEEFMHVPDEDLPKLGLQATKAGTDKKSYLETHYVVVGCITHGLADESPVLMELYAAQGRAAMWELAETLTDKFEEQNKGREWDGDWEEAVWEFVGKELEELKNKRT